MAVAKIGASKVTPQVRLVTPDGLIAAGVVKVDAANDLALPVAASRAVKVGGTVATVGFPNIGLQGFAPKVLAHGGPRARSHRCPARVMTRGISRSAYPCCRACWSPSFSLSAQKGTR